MSRYYSAAGQYQPEFDTNYQQQGYSAERNHYEPSPNLRFIEKEPQKPHYRYPNNDFIPQNVHEEPINNGWYQPADYDYNMIDADGNIPWQEMPLPQQSHENPTIPHYSLIPGLDFMTFEQQVELQKWWTFLPRNLRYEEDFFNKMPPVNPPESSLSIQVHCDEMPDPYSSLDDLQVEAFIKNNLIYDKREELTLVERYAATLFIEKMNYVAYLPACIEHINSYMIPLINKLQQTGPFPTKHPVTHKTMPVAVILVPSPTKVTPILRASIKLTYTSNIIVCGLCEGKVEMMANLRSGCHLLITTPTFLNDLMCRDVVTLKELQTLVFDGFDRIIDLGMEGKLNLISSLQETYNKEKTQIVMYAQNLSSDMSKTMKNFIKDYAHFKISAKYSECSSIGKINLYYVEESTRAQAAQELLSDIDFALHHTIIVVHPDLIQELTDILIINQMPTASYRPQKFEMGQYPNYKPSTLATLLNNRSLRIVVTTLEELNQTQIPYHVDHIMFFNVPAAFKDFIGLARCLKKSLFWSVFLSDEDKAIAKDFYHFLKTVQQEYPEWLADFADIDVNGETKPAEELIIGKNTQIDSVRNPHIMINNVTKLKSWLKKRRLQRRSKSL